jgi:hypothetical protein
MSHMPALGAPETGTAVSSNRQILTSGGLTGGGDLSADRTLSIDTDGVTTAKIADGNVTFAKIADIATARILGRVTGGAGDIEALTGTQATTLLDAFTSVLKGLVPPSGGGTSNFLRADGAWSAVASVAYYNPKDSTYGAVGDGVTNDRTAIQNCIDAAIAAGVGVLFPAGTYVVNGYLDVNGARGLHIMGTSGATIRYASDDTSILADSVALSNAHARSAFYLRNCVNVKISDLTFVGGDKTNLTTDNVGNAVSARYSIGTTVERCTARGGYAIFAEDATTDLAGTGDSLTNASGTVTVTDTAGSFVSGHVGRRITISGSTNQQNNGSFIITTYVSAQEIKYTNANAVTETSSFTWSIDCGDRGARILNCRSENTRGPIVPTNDTAIIGCWFERPLTVDACGLVDEFSFSAGTVTLTDKAARFLPSHHGKIITIAGATSGGNNVQKVLTYISSTQVSYTNASGVTEYAPYGGACTWWIANGERVGFGAGASSIAVAAGVVTFTAAASAFSSTDVGMPIRIAYASNAANEGCFAITEYVSPTVVKFANASAVNENFAGIWSVDGFDNAVQSGTTYGSSHGVYVFAGRTGVVVQACTFRGLRTTCVKASGSSLPVRNVTVSGCVAYECGEFFNAGADDYQEHSGLICDNNILFDVATSTPGRSQSLAISILGARNVSITNNKLHYSRNAIGSVDGRGNSGVFGIQCSSGGQGLEDLTVSGNKFTVDDTNCTLNNVLNTAIDVRNVGRRSKWNTGGTLTKAGNVMTLTDAGYFTAQDVGKYIELSLSPDAGNRGSFVIETVPNANTCTFTNAAGVGAGADAGTWRMYGRFGFLGAAYIGANHIHSAAQVAIYSRNNVGPEIVDNTISNGGIYISGCATPRVMRNREIATNTQTSKIRLFEGTSWPIVAENTITNQALGSSPGFDMGVGDSGGTATDYPLLGVVGRCVPTEGRPEVVVAYGSDHAPGDYIVVDGNTFTYVASAPGANQFSTFAELVALIEALANYTCADYGAPYTVTTQHLRIRRSVASTTANLFAVTSNALNPTALVMLRNSAGGHTSCQSRGEETGAGVGALSVIWSPCCAYTGGVTLWPDNAAGQTLLQANGYRSVKAQNDAGACEVVNHGDAAGTETFRWAVR